jgi:hypothetical protein
MAIHSASCCITRTEISVGDPAFVVFAKPYFELNTARLADKDSIYHAIPRKFSTNQILNFSHLPLNERLLDDGRSSGKFLYLSVENYGHSGGIPGQVENILGEYDRYGFWWENRFIAHKSLCESILGRELGEGIQLERDFYDLIKKCYTARIEIYQDKLAEHNWTKTSKEELEIQEIVQAERRKILDIKKQQLTNSDK